METSVFLALLIMGFIVLFSLGLFLWFFLFGGREWVNRHS
jgi:hypothetical protein